MKGFATKKFPGSLVGLKSYSTLGSLNKLRYSKQNLFMTRAWLSLPAHKVVAMPSLSPTMESGSIAKWNVKVGDRFEPGTSLCDVETDKATVSFDATDEGYLAKILISSGDIKVGQPLIVTVEEAADVAAFANFTLDASAAPAAPAPPKAQPAAPVAAPAAPAAPITPPATPAASSSSSSDKIFASPLAKKMIRESNGSLSEVKSVLGEGSGPNGRIVAADVLKAASLPKAAPVVAPVAAPAATPKASATPAAVKSAPVAAGNDTYADFQLSEVAQELAHRLYQSKQTIPHYYVSVEINLTELLKLRQQLNAKLFANKKPVKGEEDNADKGISAFDLLVKAAALSMRQVPDVNASWMDTFIRRYEQVDINVVMGSGSLLATPVLKDVASRGVLSISEELAGYESTLSSNDSAKIDAFLSKSTSIGTFSIHNLGVYGVKSAAPIVIAPQSAALSLGAIVDTVIPKATPSADGVDWEVAPIMTATLSNDHRVINGAVSAQWLAAFKQLVENPMNLIL